MKNRNRQKILIVGLFPPPFSSGERVITQYVYDLLRDRYEVHCVNMSIGVLAPPSFGPSSLVYYVRVLLNFMRVFRQVYVLSRQHEYGLCYLTPASSILGHLRDTFIVRLLNPKVKHVVINIQNGNYSDIFKRGWHSGLTRRYIQRISLAIFTSEILMKRSLPFIDESKCAIVRNTVDRNVLCTDAEVAEWMDKKREAREFRVCYISNMTPSKGYLDLLEALVRMNENERSTVRVDFVGEWLSAQQRSNFEKLVSANCLTEHIRIHGKVNDRSKLKALYLNASAFVLPTYFPREAQPVSIIEALNCGVPVISTRHASIPDLITDGYNGFLIDIQSPEQVKTALLQLKDRNDTWYTLASNARKSFTQHFTAEKIKADLLVLVAQELKAEPDYRSGLGFQKVGKNVRRVTLSGAVRRTVEGRATDRSAQGHPPF